MNRRMAALLLSFALFISGCAFFPVEQQYTFLQNSDQIVSIDIVTKAGSVETGLTFNIVQKVDAEDHQRIIDAILAADGNVVLEGAGYGFGDYMIRITYRNGEVELIGQCNNGYIALDGTLWQDCYMFDYDQFYAIISEFVKDEPSVPKNTP